MNIEVGTIIIPSINTCTYLQNNIWVYVPTCGKISIDLVRCQEVARIETTTVYLFAYLNGVFLFFSSFFRFVSSLY